MNQLNPQAAAPPGALRHDAPVVRPLTGGGIVAHAGAGLLLACEATDDLTAVLLDGLWRAATAADPGPTFIRHVARALADAMRTAMASCAVAGPADGGAVVLVSGTATITVVGAEGELTLGGRTALTWTDRFVAGPLRRIELRLPGAGDADPRLRLDAGVVPGGGLHWLADPSQAPARPVAPPVPPRVPGGHAIPAAHPVPPIGHPLPGHPAGPTRPRSEPADEPAEKARPPRERPAPGDIPPDDVRSQPFESVLLIEPDGTPAPAAPAPPTRTDPEPDARPMVWGGDCKNGHFNDPRSHYCAVCGIGMAQLTIVPKLAPRPPLGVLVLDDGMALRLDTDYVMGRDPERAEDVRSGKARPARVDDTSGSVSRRHLRVRLNEWNVELLDLGSVNGTHVQLPGATEFRQLASNQPVQIWPGTTVRLGASRSFRYESHRKR
jgi:FHA domain-containing protein